MKNKKDKIPKWERQDFIDGFNTGEKVMIQKMKELNEELIHDLNFIIDKWNYKFNLTKRGNEDD